MKKVTIDYVVGLFMILGFLAFVYLSMQLGEFSVFSMERNYAISAQFDNVSGLKAGAAVEIAGVSIGKVAEIILGDDDLAVVTLLINRDVKLTSDAIASIRTQGIIGDKYIRVFQGGDSEILQAGDMIWETESAVDLEKLISQYIFGSSKEKGEE